MSEPSFGIVFTALMGFPPLGRQEPINIATRIGVLTNTKGAPTVQRLTNGASQVFYFEAAGGKQQLTNGRGQYLCATSDSPNVFFSIQPMADREWVVAPAWGPMTVVAEDGRTRLPSVQLYHLANRTGPGDPNQQYLHINQSNATVWVSNGIWYAGAGGGGGSVIALWIPWDATDCCANSGESTSGAYECRPKYSSITSGQTACLGTRMYDCSRRTKDGFKDPKCGPAAGSFARNSYNNGPMGNFINWYQTQFPYYKDTPDPLFSQALPGTAGLPDGVCTGPMLGACDQVLGRICAPYDRTDLLADPELQELCGCHMGPSAPGRPTYPYPQAKFSCDPICLNAGTIPNGAAPTCTQSVCVMDNIAVNIINSSTGNVSFDQVCSGCGGSGDENCVCYISDVAVNVINSHTGSLNLSQNCGSCYTFPKGDPTNVTKVDCGTFFPTPSGGGGGGGGGSNDEKLVLFGAAGCVGLALLVLAVALIYHYTRKKAT